MNWENKDSEEYKDAMGQVRLFLETVCKRGEGGLWLKALNRSEKTGEE